jgi:hypothetical protein
MLIYRNVVLALCLILAFCGSASGGFISQFKDPADSSFDASLWLSQRYGFIPILSIITEPAIGPGASLGLMFLHRSQEDADQPMAHPPSVSGLLGAYTTNDSWAAGGGHFGYWKDDRIRYRGGLGYASANLKYYPDILFESIDFNLKGSGTMHEISFRIKDSNLFLGARYIFSKTTAAIEIPLDSLDIAPWEMDVKIGGLGALATYDSRDNTFTPNKGIRAEIAYIYYDEFFGGDRTYQRLNAFALGFLPVTENLYSGLRLDGRFSFDRAPFYTLPYIDLRGVPAMRYQGRYAVLAETEWRWDFTRRWSLDFFGGMGRTAPRGGDFSDGETAWNAGGGFRYLLARLFGLRAGCDVARGPEEWAFYIVVGSRWGMN